MFDENLYQETISALHASEDTLSEVMNMTHKTKRRGRLRTTAVLAAVNLTDELLKSQDAAENLRQLQRRLHWISGWRSTLEQRRSRKSCSRLRRSQ